MPHSQRKQQKQESQSTKNAPELGLLRFKADGTQVALQHHSAAAAYDGNGSSRQATVPTLRVDLRSGKVWVGPGAPLPDTSSMTLGIIGLLRLEKGSILALISKAKRVCSLLDGPVYKVEDTTLVAPQSINACENDLRHASLIQEALDPKNFGSHTYFSHTANITSSRQRQADQEGPGADGPAGAAGLAARRWPGAPPAEASGGCGSEGAAAAGRLPALGPWWLDGGTAAEAGDGSGGEGAAMAGARGTGGAAAGAPAGGGGVTGGRRGGGSGGVQKATLWSRADPRFVWNLELMRPLIEAGAEAFALPLMVGYVGQATGATFTLRAARPPAPSSTLTLTTKSRTGTGDANGDSSSPLADATTGAASPSKSSSGGAGGGGGRGGSPSGARCPGELTLITRVGVGRPVAGGWRRGADRHGHTAGFAETEVILTLRQQPPERPDPAEQPGKAAPAGQSSAQSSQLEGIQRADTPRDQPQQEQQRQEGPCPSTSGVRGDGGGEEGPLRRRTRVAVASYMMARGSAPLFWAAPPDLQPWPAPRGPEDGQQHEQPFGKHVDALLKAYGRPVLLLNLIFGPHQGPQLRLHDALQKQAEAYEAKRRNTPAAIPAAAPAAAIDGGDCSNRSAAARAAAEERPLGHRDVAVAVVGMPLERGDLQELAACGEAAARLERACAPECAGMRVFLCVEEHEVTQSPPAGPPAATATATAGAAPAASPSNPTQTPSVPGVSGSGGGGGGGSGGGRRMVCVGRHVACRQEGVVRVSSGSTVSAGGCCEEVDLAQHALALPPLAAALVALGAMEDPADLERAHASVVHALAQLWSHQADVLCDQVLGTSSGAGRALEAAAADMEARGGGLLGLAQGFVRGSWRRVVGAGDAVSRYYYGSFTDARRQDALDLASGAYQVATPPAFVPRRQPPNTTFLQLGILLLMAAVVQAVMCALTPPASLQEVGMRVLGPGALGALLLVELLRRGASFVEKPLLRPQEVFPWSQ